MDIDIVMGDVTRQRADAVVVPHFQNAVSWGGVGAAVARAGGSDGLEAADVFFHANRPTFGEAFVTESKGLGAKLLNVVSVGSDREFEFVVVEHAVLRALALAGERGFKSMAIPALGTGIIGNLTAQQSAQAILSAVYLHSIKPHTALEIKLVIYGDPAALRDYSGVLKDRSYEKVYNGQVGGRKFDFARWAIGMRDHGLYLSDDDEASACGDELKKPN